MYILRRVFFLQALTVIADSVTRRSRDLALLKLEKAEPDTSGTERSFPASSDISYKYYITNKINTLHTPEIARI